LAMLGVTTGSIIDRNIIKNKGIDARIPSFFVAHR